jgi:hypothetical protein
MNSTTEKTINSFMQGEPKKVGNTYTDGKSLFLFNNMIAEHREDGLYITNAGWFSKATKERLNGLPGVNIYQAKKKWHLNGQEWDGNWIKVNDNPPPSINTEKAGKMWVLSQSWKKTDGWRGYGEPTFAVCGANDTGMWSDSPCRSDVAQSELMAVKAKLSKAKIPTKLVTCETSNVFCVHHYLVVRPIDKPVADEIVSEYINNNRTELLYPTNNN